jgi:NO-binding membrane sensor protein with MHYT domain
VPHILLFFRQQVEPHATSRTSSPTLPRSRVWRDTVAEILLCAAVAVIALTGIESFVLLLNRWLASVIPAYDPVVTMMALVIVVIGALTLGGISLKVSVRRASEGTGAAACGAVPRAPAEQFPDGDP